MAHESVDAVPDGPIFCTICHSLASRTHAFLHGISGLEDVKSNVESGMMMCSSATGIAGVRPA